MSHKTGFIALALGSLLLGLSGLATSEAAATYATLRWTAPGDDGSSGTATRYDLRYSTRSITAANFNSARAATGLPTPKAGGSQETYTLNGLATDSTYYIAIKAIDNSGNWSAVSNVAMRPSQPLAVSGDSSGVAFAQPWPNPAVRGVNLSFRLPHSARTQVHVFDVASRRIRDLEQGWHGAGTVPVTWDLRDDGGHRVAPGAYVIRATALGQQWVRRVVVIGG